VLDTPDYDYMCGPEPCSKKATDAEGTYEPPGCDETLPMGP
jgi:hypothetical protein